MSTGKKMRGNTGRTYDTMFPGTAIKYPSVHYPESPVVFLVYQKSRPGAVVKLFRTKESAKNGEHEYSLLKKVNVMGISVFNIPQPLSWDGRIMVESAFDGIAVSRYIIWKNDTRTVKEVGRILDLLIQFHRTFAKQNLRREMFPVSQTARSAIKKLRQAEITLPQKETDRFLDACSCIDRECPVPVGFMHGDFNHFNILKIKNSYALIDWEEATFEGCPLWDAFHLFAVLSMNTGRVTESYSRICGDQPLALEIKEKCLLFSQDLKIEKKIMDTLFLLYCLYAGTRYLKPRRHNEKKAHCWTDLAVMLLQNRTAVFS